MKNITGMKQFGLTTLIKYLIKGLLAAVMVLTFCQDSSSTAAGKTPNLCGKTSVDTLGSCKGGANSDYLLAIGKCDNLSTPAARKTCSQQARPILSATAS